jgi:hypothetical protein
VLSTLGEHPDYAIAASEMEAALKNRYPDRSVSVICQMGEKSPLRPCGRDVVEFFNTTVWAFSSKWRCQCGCRMLGDFAGVISQIVWSAARLQGEIVRSGSTVCANVSGLYRRLFSGAMMMIRACWS